MLEGGGYLSFMIIDGGGFPLLESFRGGFGGDSSSVCSKFSVLPDNCPQSSMNGGHKMSS